MPISHLSQKLPKRDPGSFCESPPRTSRNWLSFFSSRETRKRPATHRPFLPYALCTSLACFTRNAFGFVLQERPNPAVHVSSFCKSPAPPRGEVRFVKAPIQARREGSSFCKSRGTGRKIPGNPGTSHIGPPSPAALQRKYLTTNRVRFFERPSSPPSQTRARELPGR